MTSFTRWLGKRTPAEGPIEIWRFAVDFLLAHDRPRAPMGRRAIAGLRRYEAEVVEWARKRGTEAEAKRALEAWRAT